MRGFFAALRMTALKEEWVMNESIVESTQMVKVQLPDGSVREVAKTWGAAPLTARMSRWSC
jgi:hypothetical protein